MARLTGKNLVVRWIDGDGTLNIPTVREFDPGTGFDVAETSAAGDSMRNYQTTIENFEPTFKYVNFDGTESGVAGTAIRQRLAPNSVGTIEWFEQGTATGKPYGAAKVAVSKHSSPTTYDDAKIVDVELKAQSGTWVADPGTAVVS